VQRYHVPLLHRGEPGLAPFHFAPHPRHRHALARARLNQVGLEPVHHAKDVEQQPVRRVGRVLDGPAEVQPHLLAANSSAMSVAPLSYHARRSSLVTLAVSRQRLSEALAVRFVPVMTLSL
jgi:hypothetical protein